MKKMNLKNCLATATSAILALSLLTGCGIPTQLKQSSHKP